MKPTHRKLAHRASIAAAIASLLVTTSIALLDAPVASADPSARARADRARSTRSAGKLMAPKKRARRIPAAKPVTGVVNINTATAAQLRKLPGIGPAKAERIVAFRQKRGKFRRVRDLRRVKGIGRMTIKKLARHLAISGPTTLR